MNKKYDEILNERCNTIDEITIQRRKWLYASSLFFITVVIIMFSWPWISHLSNPSGWWVVTAILLIISVNWWYWTIGLIAKLLDNQRSQVVLIKSLVETVDEMIKEFKQQ